MGGTPEIKIRIDTELEKSDIIIDRGGELLTKQIIAPLGEAKTMPKQDSREGQNTQAEPIDENKTLAKLLSKYDGIPSPPFQEIPHIEGLNTDYDVGGNSWIEQLWVGNFSKRDKDKIGLFPPGTIKVYPFLPIPLPKTRTITNLLIFAAYIAFLIVLYFLQRYL